MSQDFCGVGVQCTPGLVCQMSRVCVVSVYQMSVDTAKCHLCVCGVYQMSTGHFWS